MNCSSPANACSYQTAVTGAGSGDEVILASGDYGSSILPIATNVASGQPNLYVHGVLGQPRPRIFSSAVFALGLNGMGDSVRWLEIDSSNATNGVGLDFWGSLAEQVLVRRTNSAGNGTACRLNLNALARNDVCQASGTATWGVLVTGVVNGPNTVTLRNVTATAQGAGANGLEADSTALAGRSSAVTMINTLVRGDPTGFDVRAANGGQPDSVATNHSNYVTTSATGGATISDNGTSQTAAPLLSGDYHELSGSPTIDAGISDAANGDLDADGAARTQGASVDIGAFEFPSSAPVSAPVSPVSQPAPAAQVPRRKKCKKKRKRAAEVAKKHRCKKRKKH